MQTQKSENQILANKLRLKNANQSLMFFGHGKRLVKHLKFSTCK